MRFVFQNGSPQELWETIPAKNMVLGPPPMTNGRTLASELGTDADLQSKLQLRST